MPTCPCGRFTLWSCPWDAFDPLMVEEDEVTCRYGSHIFVHKLSEFFRGGATV